MLTAMMAVMMLTMLTTNSNVTVRCVIISEVGTSGVEIKPNFPLAWGMSSPEKLLVPNKNQ